MRENTARAPRLAWLARTLTWGWLWLWLAGGAAALPAAGDSLAPGAQDPTSAWGEDAFDQGEARVEARLLVHPDDSGNERRLGVLFRLDEGWHLYWRNPGQSGLPTQLAWNVDAAQVGELAWPVPRAFDESEGELTTYGYENEVMLSATAQLSGDPDSPRRARVRIDFLVCRDECIPGRIDLERPLAASESSESDAAAHTRALFDAWSEQLPADPQRFGVALEARLSQSAVRPGDRFELALAVKPCAGAASDCADWAPAAPISFFPELLEGITLDTSRLQARLDGGDRGGFALRFRAHAEGIHAASPAGRIAGVLALATADGRLRHLAVDLPLPRAAAGDQVAVYGPDWWKRAATAGSSASPSPSSPSSPSIWMLLLLGFAGGLLLNLMPCVLPVLAIKVFSVAEMAQHSRREVWAHGAAYAVGILGSMTLLAAVVVSLRAAGTSVGWGFQFQEPLFLAVVCSVLVVFSLNLFGVFEIGFHGGGLAGVGQQATGARRSFFEGLLAVVLATPCSAPFLGTAVGFAFAGGAAGIFAIFLAIGSGLAAPFVAVSLAPGWRRFMPRSGPWMLKLRAGLGFALLASVIWLLWIAGRSLGSDGVIAIAALLLAVAFATWVLGLAQASPRSGPARLAIVGLAGVIVSGHAALLGAVQVAEVEAKGQEPETLQVARFDSESVQAQRGAGRAVFVYFTADWCITCKVNERMVLQDERVQAELERLDVAVFKADWTRRDDAIRAELARFGKAGVPLYLVYGPDASAEPRALPELLTVDLLIDALRSAALREVAEL